MRAWILLAAGLLVAGVSLALSRAPGVVERFYGAGVGPHISRGLSLLTGWSPVSISSLALLALVAVSGWRAVRALQLIRAEELAWGAALMGGLRFQAAVVGVLLLAFYLFWGLNYARLPLGDRLGLRVSEEHDPAQLEALARSAVERTNEAYRLLHDGSLDTGSPTALEIRPRETSRALEVGWRRIAGALELGPVAARHYGPVKFTGASWLLDATDVFGVYSPFTGEAHVTASLPSVSIPETMAHEQAHQRGITRENEATFAGLLASIHSDDPWVRYSGWAQIVRTLVGDLRGVDREVAAHVVEGLAPGPARDWDDLAAWYRASRSPAGPVASAVNNTYLRAHAVPGGTRNYGRVTELLLAWAERNGGGILVLPGVSGPGAAGQDPEMGTGAGASPAVVRSDARSSGEPASGA